jgi:hypothetical protein
MRDLTLGVVPMHIQHSHCDENKARTTARGVCTGTEQYWSDCSGMHNVSFINFSLGSKARLRGTTA